MIASVEDHVSRLKDAQLRLGCRALIDSLVAVSAIQCLPRQQFVAFNVLGLEVLRLETRSSFYTVRLCRNVPAGAKPTTQRTDPLVFRSSAQPDIGEIKEHVNSEAGRIKDDRAKFKAHEKWLHSLLIAGLVQGGWPELPARFLTYELHEGMLSTLTQGQRQRRSKNHIDLLAAEAQTGRLVAITAKIANSHVGLLHAAAEAMSCSRWLDRLRADTDIDFGGADRKQPPVVWVIVPEEKLEGDREEAARLARADGQLPFDTVLACLNNDWAECGEVRVHSLQRFGRHPEGPEFPRGWAWLQNV